MKKKIIVDNKIFVFGSNSDIRFNLNDSDYKKLVISESVFSESNIFKENNNDKKNIDIVKNEVYHSNEVIIDKNENELNKKNGNFLKNILITVFTIIVFLIINSIIR